PSLPTVIPAPMHSGHPLQEHGQKNDVHTDKRRPEVHFSPELAHLSTGRFRKPVIDAGEEPEDRSRRHDVMKMRDDVVGVVQIEVAAVEGKRNAGKAADSKLRQECDYEKHRHIEPDRPTPKGNKERAPNDD